MKLSRHFTTVTPLSKSLALLFFLVFPLVGFYAGMQYQRVVDIYFYNSFSQANILTVPTTAPRQILKIQMNDLNKTLFAKVGDTIVFSLATPFTWRFSFSPESLLEATNVAYEYKAVKVGAVDVTATGRPLCKSGQLCSQLVVYFHTTIHISQ